MTQDILFALRQLRRSPAFALTAILTMALSLGVTSAMVGVLRATLLNPLPYPEPNRLVQIADRNLRGSKTNGLVSVLRTRDLAEATAGGHKLFSRVGFLYSDDSSLTLDGHEPIRVPVAAVSGDFFPALAASPLLGRTLVPADDVLNGPQLLVISHRLWQTTFAADPAIIGRAVHLGPSVATVVGVMPPSFALPIGTDVWHPGHIFPANFGDYRGDGSRFVEVVARLDPAQTLSSAKAQTDLLATRLASAHPASDADWAFTLTTLRDSLFGEYRQALILLASAVGLVLLVAAINIAGLQLSRNAARVQEFAIRMALGITRARLLRQLLTEGLLLVLLGCGCGLLIAPLILHVLVARLPAALLQVESPHIDLSVVLLSFLLALTVGLLTALLPALQSTRIFAFAGVRTVISPAPGNTRFGRLFAALQIALSLVLLTLSTAVLQSLYRLINLPLGFQPTALQTFTIDLPWARDPARNHRIYVAAQSALAAIPGVTDVAAATALPLSSYSVRRTYDIAGQPPTPHHDAVVAEGRTYTPGYLRTMRIPLLAGRDLVPADALPGAPPVFVVNQTFARRYFSNINPIGQRLTYPGGGQVEIVGVMGDVHGGGGSLAAPIQPEVSSIEDGGWPHMQFVLRSTLPASTLEPQIRKLAAALDPAASAGHFATLSNSIDRQLTQPRLNAGLLTAFAGLSLLLVIVGVYGLFAFEVSRRTRELGLRLALGSTRAGIRNLVLSGASRILAAGLTLGLLGSLVAKRLLAGALTFPGSVYPVLLFATAALVSGAVLLASLLPARRAASIEPTQALRAE